MLGLAQVLISKGRSDLMVGLMMFLAPTECQEDQRILLL